MRELREKRRDIEIQRERERERESHRDRDIERRELGWGGCKTCVCQMK